MSELVVVPEMTYLQATQVVKAFGKVLGELAGDIADEKRLPFPKAVIKQATLMLLPFAPSEEVRSHLRAGYLYLSQFQTGVGDQTISPLPPGAKQPRNSEEMLAYAAHAEKWLPWSKRSVAEMQKLLQEIRGAGFRE